MSEENGGPVVLTGKLRLLRPQMQWREVLYTRSNFQENFNGDNGGNNIRAMKC